MSRLEVGNRPYANVPEALTRAGAESQNQRPASTLWSMGVPHTLHLYAVTPGMDLISGMSTSFECGLRRPLLSAKSSSQAAHGLIGGSFADMDLSVSH